MIDYEKIHKNLICPFCQKPLIVSNFYNNVVCQDIDCKFNQIGNMNLFKGENL